VIRVALPAHLRTLAKVAGEVQLEVAGAATQRSVLDALEALHPTLKGAIRDHATQQRRPFIRFFACGRDLSHESPDAPLPDAVASGQERLVILGALAGG
jgi:hypothetical protein